MTDSPEDKTKFNETLKRMLKTPPKPHVSNKKGESPKKAGDKRKKPED